MNDYALLDFGDGRRLERFGDVLLDRPCPAAMSVRKREPELWRDVHARFELDRTESSSQRGRWIFGSRGELADPWTLAFESFRLELRVTPFGHVGVFSEQQPNWHRITKAIAGAAARRTGPLRVLNLFAYTGGSSLAAALAGVNVEVVHLDAAKSVVDWARRNAALNGIETLPDRGRIRWIVEDVRKFVRRELKRGNRYEALILDPPGYGHGPNKAAWKIDEHLPGLLADLAGLWSDEPVLALLTAHSEGFSVDRLAAMLDRAKFPDSPRTELFEMTILSQQNATLPAGCGVALEWS